MERKTNECHACGNILLSSEQNCRYCGSRNPDYKKPTILQSVNDFIAPAKPEQPQPVRQPAQKDGLNGCLLVFLLIVFWPAGIVYLIYKLGKK